MNDQRLLEQQPCSAINCTSTCTGNNRGISFFPFPQDDELSRKWLMSVRRFDLTKKSVDRLHKENILCSLHFDDSQFASSKRDELKDDGAVPTIFNFPPLLPNITCPKTKKTKRVSERAVGHFQNTRYTDSNQRKELMRSAGPSLVGPPPPTSTISTDQRMTWQAAKESVASSKVARVASPSEVQSHRGWVPMLNLTPEAERDRIREARMRLSRRRQRPKHKRGDSKTDDGDSGVPPRTIKPDPISKMQEDMPKDLHECEDKRCLKEKMRLKRQLCHTLVLLKVLREKILDVQKLAETTELDLLSVLVCGDVRGRAQLEKLYLIVACVTNELELTKIDEEMEVGEESDIGDDEDGVDYSDDANDAVNEDNDDAGNDDIDDELAVDRKLKVHFQQQSSPTPPPPRVKIAPTTTQPKVFHTPIHANNSSVKRSSSTGKQMETQGKPLSTLSTTPQPQSGVRNRQKPVQVIFKTEEGKILSQDSFLTLVRNQLTAVKGSGLSSISSGHSSQNPPEITSNSKTNTGVAAPVAVVPNQSIADPSNTLSVRQSLSTAARETRTNPYPNLNSNPNLNTNPSPSPTDVSSTQGVSTSLENMESGSHTTTTTSTCIKTNSTSISTESCTGTSPIFYTLTPSMLFKRKDPQPRKKYPPNPNRNKEMIMCELCGKQYDRPFLYNVHMSNVHGAEKHFQCITCGKKFSTKQGLLTHFKSHSDVRPHKCTQCSKAFKSNANLRNHLLTHSKGMKRFWCELCGRGFKWNTSLNLHKRQFHSS